MEATKTAIVTGASRGIGEAIARKLASDGLFLASPASSFVTGATLNLDGGINA